jgi:hypothetical protein
MWHAPGSALVERRRSQAPSHPESGFEVGCLLAGRLSPRREEVAVDAEHRIAHNEALFREVNEHIEAGRWPTERGEPAAFRCECGSLRCNLLVELRLEEYQRVRARSTHFVVLPGHQIPAVDRVVDQGAGYLVVEKVGDTATVAEETDPRGLSQ